jgi:hypothetical protein
MAEVLNNQIELPFRYYSEKYREGDPLEISARTAVPYDEARRVFTLTLMNSVYEISHPDFSVPFLRGEADRLSGYPVGQILMLRYLVNGHYVRPGGRFVAYQDNPWGEVYIRSFTGRCIRRLAHTFAGKGEEIARKMAALDGKPYEKGDFGWEFAFMPGLSIRFSVWNADEDFPPSAQILFSDNFHYAFDAEDMAYVGDVFIKLLSQI